ncbi:MAG TPA: hypothetical protein VF914_13445 [Chloroflexia bacterium]
MPGAITLAIMFGGNLGAQDFVYFLKRGLYDVTCDSPYPLDVHMRRHMWCQVVLTGADRLRG